MSLFFPASEFFESSGNTAAEYTESLRDGAASFACSLWANYPNFIVEAKNPLNSFVRGYMNSACSAVQSPPPFEPPPFVGGQCCDKTYTVSAEWALRRCADNPVINGGSGSLQVTGKLIGLELRTCLDNPAFTCLDLVYEDCLGVLQAMPFVTDQRPLSPSDCSDVTAFDPLAEYLNPVTSTYSITGVVTTDGSPDDCGTIETFYPDNPPPPGGVTEIINITNVDGTSTSHEITWNQFSDTVNFPISMSIDGVSVTLDMSGLTIHGDPEVTSPSGNKDIKPPGSKTKKFPTGDPYTKVFFDQVTPVLPDQVTPELADGELDWFICTDGAIEVIEDTIGVVPGIFPGVKILLSILKNLIEEICGDGDVPDLGFPETYPVIPGRQRPAIVLYYKELIDGKRTGSTYTSTVPHPSAAAITGFDSLEIPDKATGTHIASVALEDGSRAVVSGLTVEAAIENLEFLVSLISPVIAPVLSPVNLVLTQRGGIVERDLNCSQIEYYSSGRAAGVNPDLLRFIPPPGE